MKIFSDGNARPPLSRSKAWNCLLINALVCPGLGSLMARRFSGVPQLVLAWGGAIWMVVELVRFFAAYIRLLQRPPDWMFYLNSGLAGLAFFLASWVWSICTGVLVIYRSQPNASPGEPPLVKK